MRTTGVAKSVVAQGVMIVVVLIAGVVVAAVKPANSSASPAGHSASTLGTSLCYGFGRATVSQYAAVAKLPDVEADITTLRGSSDWASVSDALTELAALGAPSAWSTTQRATARTDLAALRAACAPHLPSR